MIGLNRKGFTLVEIMIVVAIIALLAAIAIPNLLRARLNANETAAIAAVGTISSACQSYRAANPNIGFPALLVDLTLPVSNPPYIDTVIGAGTKQGYIFAYTAVAVGGINQQYHIWAHPVTPNTTGIRGFYVDEQGVIGFINPDPGADPGHAPAAASVPAGWFVLQ